MRSTTAPTTLRRTGSTWANLVARALLLALATAAPWFFGGFMPSVLWAGGLVLLLGFFLWAWAHGAAGPGLFHVTMHTAAIPLILGMVLASAFLVPLPNSWVRVLSPQAHEYWGLAADPVRIEPTPGLPPQDAGDRWLTLAMNPAGARQDLALLVWAASAFLLGSLLFVSRAAAVSLLAGLTVAATLQAGFGLVQLLTWNGKLFWRYPLPNQGQPFGTFVNGNHSAALMSLGLAAAVGLVFWSFRAAQPTALEPAGWRGRILYWWDRFLAILVGVNAASASAFGAAVLMAAGILASRSRGAIAATLVGGLTTLCLVWLAQRRSFKQLAAAGCIAILAAAGGLLLLLFTELEGGLQEDVRSLQEPQRAVRLRMAHWRDGLRAATAFRGIGSGLGSYRYVYRPQQRRVDSLWFYHAENQYLETLTELGVAGLAALFATLALALLAAWRLLLAEDRGSQALGVAGIFGLCSQTLHAGFDFALYSPAVALVAALLFGAVCGRAGTLTLRDTAAGWFARRGPWAMAVVAVAAPVALSWAMSETWTRWAVQRGVRYAVVPTAPLQPEVKSRLALLADLEAGIGRRPDDVEARLAAAALCQDLYRLARLQRDVASDADSQERDAQWAVTSPLAMHAQARRNPEAVRQDALARQYLRRALDHAIWARHVCPLEWRAHQREAELAAAWLPLDADQHAAGRAVQLSLLDPEAYFFAGVLAVNARNRRLAQAYWQRCLLLDDSYSDRVVTAARAATSFDEEQIYREYFPLSPALWLRYALKQRPTLKVEGRANLRRLIAGKLSEMSVRVMDPALQAYWDGHAQLLLGNTARGLQQWEKALALRPEASQWRLELAEVLFKEGRVAEAWKQVQLGLSLDPTHARLALLAELIEQDARRPAVDGAGANPPIDRDGASGSTAIIRKN